jgi:two-component sensor histidine kinase
MSQEASSAGGVRSFPLLRAQDTGATALIAIIRRLAAARSIPEIMVTVTHAARTLLSADGITFVLRDGDLCFYAEEDAIAPLWKGKRFPAQTCISGWCMENASQVAIADITLDDRIPQDAYRATFVKSLAMVPVRQEEPIAALGAYWATFHEATAQELDLLQTVANAAALATAFVQLQEQRRVNHKLHRLASNFSDQLQELSVARIERLRRRPLLEVGKSILIGVAFSSAALALRWVLTPLLAQEIPFATFYLAVACAVFWAGLTGGLTAALVGGLLGTWALVEPAHELSLAGSRGWGLITFLATASFLAYLMHRLLVAQLSERAVKERLKLIGEELQHRYKNFIAVTQALAVQTSRTSADHKEFRAKFIGRLQALGRAQSLLKEAGDSDLPLDELISRTLEPFGLSRQVSIGSLPQVLVSQEVGTGLALVLNELATNALKHGSLSAAEGQVTIRAEADEQEVQLVWEETGGPEAVEPTERNFGMRLIRTAMPRGSGSTQLEFLMDGLVCLVKFRYISKEE